MAEVGASLSGATILETDWLKKQIGLYWNVRDNSFQRKEMELNILSIKKEKILCDTDFIYWIHHIFQADSGKETKIN